MTTKINDWRELPASDELDRAVAVTLGWRMELRSEPAEWLDEDRFWWCVRPGLYDERIDNYKYLPNESIAWDAAFKTYEGHDSILFRWSRDADDDYLPLARFCWWTFMSPGEGSVGTLWTAEIWASPDDVEAVAVGYGKTLAEARVKCWLAWKEKELERTIKP